MPRNLVREHTDAAIGILVTAMNNEASPTAQVNAAKYLIDRGYGRPPQALEIDLKERLAREWVPK